MNTFNPTLHGLRGLAALAVLIFHWGETFPAFRQEISANWGIVGKIVSQLIGFGWVGVLLFFVLSGFLLTTSNGHMAFNKKALGVFWARRFLRIYPAVWLQLIILSSLLGVLHGLNVPANTGQWLSNITLFVNLPPYLPYPVNAVWWTLPIELSFYLIFPLLLLFAKRHSFLTLLITAMVITLAWRIAVMWYFREEPGYGPVQPYLDLLPGCLAIFVMGMYAAHQSMHLSAIQQKLVITLSLAALGTLMYWLTSNASHYWNGHWMLAIWNFSVSIVLATIVWVTGKNPEIRKTMLSGKLPVFFGEVSFGIYLWHFPVLLAFHQWTSSWQNNPWISLLILPGILLPTLILASISYYCIERPAMRLGKRLGSTHHN